MYVRSIYQVNFAGHAPYTPNIEPLVKFDDMSMVL